MEGCTCDQCKEMCNRPCWPTPKEAERLIKAGFGAKLMCDYWCSINGDINILCPAIVGSEGQRAPSWPTGRCTFQNEDGLCEIHDLGLKPIEGRLANCEKENPIKDLHEMLSVAWDNDGARTLCREWHTLTF